MLISFKSKKVAEKIKPKPNIAMISISDPYENVSLKKGWKYLLSLKFHDVEEDIKKISIISSGKKIEEFTPTIFNEKMAKKIINYVNSLPKEITTIIVHCRAGVSRSAAVAKFLSEIYNEPFPEDYYFYRCRAKKKALTL